MCLLIMFSLAMGGCAATPEFSPDPLGVTPMDFAIDLTVLSGEDMKGHPEAHLRQSRMVLFSDGSLHFGTDNERGADWMPRLTRRLTREQVAEIWSLSQQLGFADPENGSVPTNFNLVQPEASEVVYLMAFTGGDTRWEFVRRSDLSEDGSQVDPASLALVRKLAELAWASDLPFDDLTVMPNRYDFGPDPYARYRDP